MSLSENCIATSAALLLALLFGTAAAASPAGIVTQVSGPLLARTAGGAIKVLAVDAPVEVGDTLASQSGTYARIRFADNGEVILQPHTQLRVEQFSFHEAAQSGDGAVFSLAKGSVRVVTGALGTKGQASFRIVMPTLAESTSEITIDQSEGSTFIAEYVPAPKVDTAMVDAVRRTLMDVRPAGGFAPLLLAMNGDAPRFDVPMPLHSTDRPEPLRLDQLAQNTPGSGGGLAPGLYVHVIDGLIQLSNRGGVQQFAAGQFGFTGSVVQPPVVVPKNPGIQFTPPPAFTSSTAPKTGTGSSSKPKTVDCEVR